MRAIIEDFASRGVPEAELRPRLERVLRDIDLIWEDMKFGASNGVQERARELFLGATEAGFLYRRVSRRRGRTVSALLTLPIAAAALHVAYGDLNAARELGNPLRPVMMLTLTHQAVNRVAHSTERALINNTTYLARRRNFLEYLKSEKGEFEAPVEE